MLAIGEKAVAIRSAVLGCWREVLFWMLLLPAFSALASTAPRRQDAGLLKYAAFCSVQSPILAGSETKAGICRLGANQLASHGPLHALRTLDVGQRLPPVEVLPPADQGEAGLEQSGEVRSCSGGSGGNYCRGYLLTLLLYLAKRTAWPCARLAEVIAAALILCGGSRWQCRDHLAAIEFHCSDGMSFAAPSD
jgi:hypothetical protein